MSALNRSRGSSTGARGSAGRVSLSRSEPRARSPPRTISFQPAQWVTRNGGRLTPAAVPIPFLVLTLQSGGACSSQVGPTAAKSDASRSGESEMNMREGRGRERRRMGLLSLASKPPAPYALRAKSLESAPSVWPSWRSPSCAHCPNEEAKEGDRLGGPRGTSADRAVSLGAPAISRAFSPVVGEVAAEVQVDPEARWIRIT
jgi:hypothetical protein